MSTEQMSDLVKTARKRLVELNSRTLIISHLPKDIFLKDLLRHFKSAVNARFPDKKFKGNKKYAFLEFASEGDAKRALLKSASVKFKGVSPKCESALQKVNDGNYPDPKACVLKHFLLTSLNVSCLHRNTTDEEIKALFPDAKEINMPHAGPGKTQGTAKVVFASEDQAVAVFKSAHGKMLHDCPIVVNFCLLAKTGKSRKAISGDSSKVLEFRLVKKKSKNIRIKRSGSKSM